MVIIKKQENETIIKQLTDLLNKSFEQSLAETIKYNNTLRIIKNSKNYPEAKRDAAIILTDFIANWINNTYYDSLSCYSCLMNYNDQERFFEVFNKRPYGGIAFKARLNRYYNGDPGPFPPLFEKRIIPLTIRLKEHNSSIEESLLVVVKPFLVNEFLEALMDKLDATLELLSIVNHCND